MTQVYLIFLWNSSHFNSHAHVERDLNNQNIKSALYISTHTLTWSVTPVSIGSENLFNISTHTLTWSVTQLPFTLNHLLRFQLTRSRGAWPFCVKPPSLTSSFQLTRSRGAWRIDTDSVHCYSWFQLTRSRGAWRICLSSFISFDNFNSHAHVERDVENDSWKLTNGQFQLTRSRGAWHDKTTLKGVKGISTHTLTWSVTLNISHCNGIYTFQLTRSRGAWRRTYKNNEVAHYFNSHAHVERDLSQCNTSIRTYHFNSHAHVERDLPYT